MIAFLHTLNSSIDKFDALVKKYASDQEVKHFVNEAILTNALETGETDYVGFDAAVEKIKEEQPELIICTCSSYGEASDKRGDVLRIDRPMAEYTVGNYSRIGLAYAAASTRVASANLLMNAAKSIGKTIEIVDVDCTQAWAHFQEKDMVQYATSIAHTIQDNATRVEAVFLAQASMEGAKAYLEELKIEVLASPEYGVKQLLKKEDI